MIDWYLSLSTLYSEMAWNFGLFFCLIILTLSYLLFICLNIDATITVQILHTFNLGSHLRAYIASARKVSPSVPRELEEYIASAYSSIRQEEARSDTPHSYTTIRTLLSILRLSAVSHQAIFRFALYSYSFFLMFSLIWLSPLSISLAHFSLFSLFDFLLCIYCFTCYANDFYDCSC